MDSDRIITAAYRVKSIHDRRAASPPRGRGDYAMIGTLLTGLSASLAVGLGWLAMVTALAG